MGWGGGGGGGGWGGGWGGGGGGGVGGGQGGISDQLYRLSTYGFPIPLTTF